MGTAPLACASLDALARHPGCAVRSVVTQPDKPRGRRLQLQPSAVKQLALELGLPVRQPAKARDPEFLRQLEQDAPELIVVAAYGQILPPAILNLPRFGCFNVHTSLLPKYRGAAPIQWAILNGDSETGVTIMQMDEGLDTGAILSTVTTPIHPGDNAATLHDRLAQLGASLLIETIDRYVQGQIQPQPQPSEGACYARKLSKEDGLLDWSKPAAVLWNQVRALTPWPGAHTLFHSKGSTRTLKILEAKPNPDASASESPGEVLGADKSGIHVACGTQALTLLQLQLEGGKPLNASAFLTGHPLHPGDRLG